MQNTTLHNIKRYQADLQKAFLEKFQWAGKKAGVFHCLQSKVQGLE